MLKNEHISARKYAVFSPAQLLSSWCEQRPSNQGDLDSSVTAEDVTVYYTGWICS
jgi:hypothetical protein